MIQDVVPPRRRQPKPKRTETPQPAISEPAVVHPQAAHQTPQVEPAPTEQPFQTPEAIAKAEEQETLSSLGKDATSVHGETVFQAEHKIVPGQRGGKRRLRLWRPRTRRQWLLTVFAAVVVIGGGFAAWWFLVRSTPPVPTPKKVVVKKTIAPQPTYSNLSGLPITDASLNKKPVTAVMIENSTDARPQSGLSDAGVVFEAVAEGGITRFMALYQDTAPTSIGPIRSSRPYYVQWALGFDAAYAHAGGSPDALSDIKAWGVQDMNLLNYSSYAHRTSRPSPHNLYSGVDTLSQLENKLGYSSTFTGFPRVSGKEAPSAAPTASTIDFAMSSALYNPHYVYDATANAYLRSIDGVAQTDANTGKQLEPKVVIAIVVPLTRGALDASGAYYSDYNVLGSGQAYIFQNGDVTQGTWHKAGNTDMLTFTDGTGAPVKLNRGQTWISAVSAGNQVKYTGTSTKQ